MLNLKHVSKRFLSTCSHGLSQVVVVVNYHSQMSLVLPDTLLPSSLFRKVRLPNIVEFVSLIQLHNKIVKKTPLNSEFFSDCPKEPAPQVLIGNENGS